jgi:hypothetical protein
MILELPLSEERVDIRVLNKKEAELKEKCIKCSCDKLITYNLGGGLQLKCTRCSSVWSMGGDTNLLNMTQAQREDDMKLHMLNNELMQQSYMEEELDAIW